MIDPTPTFTITPQRKAKIRRYLKWLERHAPIWDEDVVGEEKREIKTYEVNLICCNCIEGYMIATNQNARMSDSVRYWHRCENCGHSEAISGKTYPIKSIKPDADIHKEDIESLIIEILLKNFRNNGPVRQALK